MKKTVFTFIAASLLFASAPASSQKISDWQVTQNVQSANQRILPNKSVTFKTDLNKLKHFLNNLSDVHTQAKIISLPNPDGTFEDFKVWKSSIMEKELQDKYSEIQTFTGVSTENPFRTIMLDFTLYGFHAMVIDDDRSYFIDPLNYYGGDDYQVYYKSDYTPADKTIHPCLVDDEFNKLNEDLILPGGSTTVYPMAAHGTTKKTFRLALSCTGEYAVAVTGSSAPTKAAVLSAMVTTMNRVNGIYQKEMAIKMNIIANNDLIIYTSASGDPFTANNNGGLLLSQNHNNLTTVIGGSAYDIGHIFSTGGGGIASLGSVCASTRKGQGVTGSPTPYGDAYDVDYVAHEMGHQFGANHTFNNCAGNENYNTAFEPGSGSTIMAYAGICYPYSLNLQNNSHDYFHPTSLLEMSAFVNGESMGGVGASCGTNAPSHAAIAFSYATQSKYIPKNTAFEVEAPTVTWSVSPNLKYSWEQWDLGTLQTAENTGATKTSGPIFRSYPQPSFNQRVRSFPRADSVLKNKYSYLGERTPMVGRTVRVKGTVRGVGADGYGAWNVASNSITVNVDATSSAFQVTEPNTASVVWTTNAYNNVKWSVSGTDATPINASTVDIYLSIDGGNIYNLVASAVPNNGNANVFVNYGLATTKARIKVKGSNNFFYDVSNANFIINEGPSSINGNDFNKHYSIFPNPANDVLNITNINEVKNARLTITDVMGKIFITQVVSNQNEAINVSGLANGVYMVIITTEEGNTFASKFIKK